MTRIHHVNLHVPPAVLAEEAEFLVDVLGFRRVTPPPELADRAHWFDDADGVQIHLSKVEDRPPLDPGHVAVVLGDRFDQVVDRIRGSGQEVAGDGPVVNCTDPAGNRWELRAS